MIPACCDHAWFACNTRPVMPFGCQLLLAIPACTSLQDNGVGCSQQLEIVVCGCALYVNDVRGEWVGWRAIHSSRLLIWSSAQWHHVHTIVSLHKLHFARSTTIRLFPWNHELLDSMWTRRHSADGLYYKRWVVKTVFVLLWYLSIILAQWRH